MPSNDKKETFFPGVMKPLVLDNFTPLANAAGEKRIKLDLIMDLSDNQIVGIPEFLEDAIKLVRRADSGSAENKSVVELDDVILRFYTSADADTPKIELQGVLLKRFTVRRSSKETPHGELADSELVFQAYVYYMKNVWDWAFHNFNRTVLCSFGTQQARISFGPPAKDGKPEGVESLDLFDGKSAAANDKPLEGDDIFLTQPGETDEEARVRALDPKHDPLFAGPAPVPARGRRGLSLTKPAKPN